MSYMYAQPTNNPFASDSGGAYDAAASASSRFPDINNIGGGPSQQQQPQPQSQYGQPTQGYGQNGYGQSGFMQQQPQQTGYMQQQPQQPNTPYGMGQGMGMQQTGMQTGMQQTPSSFGYSSPVQQYPPQQSQFMGGQYQPHMGMQSPVSSNPTGFPYQPPQQPQNNYQNVVELDPYSALSSASFTNSQPQSSYQPQSQYQPSQPQQQQQQPSQYGEHPRMFVNKFKIELEHWDTVAWKQLVLRIAGLRNAWEGRKKDLSGALEGARYNGWTPSEILQCQGMVKEANDNIDTCHASDFQLQEVQSGYRHSTDPASKSRVREALNAGLKTLPEFPQPL